MSEKGKAQTGSAGSGRRDGVAGARGRHGSGGDELRVGEECVRRWRGSTWVWWPSGRHRHWPATGVEAVNVVAALAEHPVGLVLPVIGSGCGKGLW